MITESTQFNSHQYKSNQPYLITNPIFRPRFLALTLAALLATTLLPTISMATPPSPPTHTITTDTTRNINNSNEYKAAAAALQGRANNYYALNNITPASTNLRSRLVGWTDSRCNNCHIPNATFSHPTGVTPTQPLPQSFPLVNGKIECITCHAADDAADHARARNNKTPLLRGNRTGDAFCAQCHDPAANNRRNMHAFASGSAHFSWDDNAHMPGSSGPSFAYPRGMIAERENCLSCHDGLIASNAEHTEYGRTGRISGSLGNSHPINMPYRISNPGDSDVNLKPEQLLDKRIRLFNGTVQCASCHSLFSQRKNLLVMSNYGSNLCLNCHQF